MSCLPCKKCQKRTSDVEAYRGLRIANEKISKKQPTEQEIIIRKDLERFAQLSE